MEYLFKSKKIDPKLYPFESHYHSLGQHQYHYIDEGQGAPVVMVHGNPSWSFYFRELIKRLSPKYRCIVPDHIGMGYSDKPGEDQYSYTLPQRVNDLENFLVSNNIQKDITLVLHDWGGIIGMGYAIRHPESIRRIILLNTAAFHIPEEKKLPVFIRLTRTALGAFFVRAFNAFCVGATYIGVTRTKMPREIREAYCAPYNSWDNRIAILKFVQDIPLNKRDYNYDFVTDIQNNLHLFQKTPVLIAWGLKDRVFDATFLKKWMEYLPQAEVHRFEDCGHYVLEDAQQEIGLLIENFLGK